MNASADEIQDTRSKAIEASLALEYDKVNQLVFLQSSDMAFD